MTQDIFELSPEWSPRVKRTVALVALAGFLLVLFAVSEILPIIIISALLAFLLTPVTTFLERHVMRVVPFLSQNAKRGWAVLMTFMLMIMFIILAVLVIVPALVTQLEDFGRGLPEMLTTVESEIERILSEPITFNGEPVLLDGQPIIPLDRIAGVTGSDPEKDLISLSDLDLSRAAETFLSSARSLTGPAFSFLGGAFTTVVNFSFLLMLTFYLLKDGARFIGNAVRLAPEGYEGDAARLVRELGGVWNAYIRGQAILCVTMGVSVYAAATIMGVPNAPILGLLSGMLEFIPNLGPLLALIPAALLALVSESSTLPFLEGLPFMIAVIVVWTGLQNIEALFLVPRVMGDSLDLHPVAVIVAVLSGAALAGPLGVILAAPTLATARVFARYIYGKLTNRAPFAEPHSIAPPQPGFIMRFIQRMATQLPSRQTPRPPDDLQEGLL